MIDINKELNRLINFSLQNNLIKEDDIIYSSNMLIGTLGLDDFKPIKIKENLETPSEILENILDFAVSKKIIENTTAERDLFDTKIMNCLMPRPSEVRTEFNNHYKNSPKEATEYFYNLSIASNYIRKDRINKNVIWKTETPYGNLDITINLSKPEKDPKDIAKAKLIKSTSYPKCLLCKENEGFFGNLNHPARQTHRLIPLKFNSKDWFLQYSPYTYYNEHCIIFNSEHIPMKISKTTFENLINFLDVLPHYFAGSNADLPIVGGSILSHDHYQGGNYTFAMEEAPIEKAYYIEKFKNVEIGRVKWPMSVLRLSSTDKEELIDAADYILTSWRKYSDPSIEILSESNGEPHNTITPISRKRNGKYELDLVLRNNRTSEEYPLGIFHPHNEVHHIKKENIGLIEVMGLAVLPARLKVELSDIKDCLLKNESSISKYENLSKHADWYKEILNKYSSITEANVDDILRNEVGLIFLEVLCHAGVFKRNEEGLAAFDKFAASLKA
ncbi:UTP-hexose-1-phosphate uridylyltransferase [Clostridium sp. DSM 8431]|uniref:UDP-glucose--hexose-1-phosphate uridylyltransferase n=1 Tax=Clostridium sp. DSM 8431 TaxID=1761781 RepID=UPI0008EA57C5|nr:UDP-glucose--hexose-1-phosphate uridylyltransferase [Clostridium sp. DSM 8431]SFU80616.1 UTP-hexose-1-phosphate uridylyltransferase [Clostridium sp. DSM 8431]